MPAKLNATADRVASRWTAHKVVAKRSSSAVNAGSCAFSARALNVCSADCDRGRISCSHAAPAVAASATTTPASNKDRPPAVPIV